MKPILFLLFSFITSCSMNAQDITGQWNGIIKFQGMQLRAVFHISKTDSGYSSTMDSPDQGVKGLPVTTTTFENSQLKLESKISNFEYTGELQDSVITGTLKQNGFSIPLTLSKSTGEIAQNMLPKRPQEPQKPYPYYSEDVSFNNNQANVTLAGTLTLPKKEGVYPR